MSIPGYFQDDFGDVGQLIDRITAALTTPDLLLGTYSYLDTNDAITTCPAIYYIQNSKTDPPDWDKSGLECQIRDLGATGRPYFAGRSQFTEGFEIRLIQHNRSARTKPAYLALQKIFPDLERQIHIEQNDEAEEQLNLIVHNTELI